MFKKLIVLFLVFTALLICSPLRSEEGSYKIKVGASPVVSSSGIFLAVEKGYFKEQGLDVEVTYFKESGAPMTVPLSQGGLDVGGGNISAGLWNAVGEGTGIKLVADKGHIEKDKDYIGLLVRKDLVDSKKYKKFKDMKGFKMGLTAFGVSQQIAAEKFLKLGGLALKDVTFEKMPYSQMNMALENKTLDATVQLEPYLTKAQLDGLAVEVAGVYKVYPNQQSAALFYSNKFIMEHPVLAEKFMIAYLKGVRAYVDAFINKKEKPEAIAMLKKHVAIDSDQIWNTMVPTGLNPDGFLDMNSLASDLSWYKENGYIKTMPELSKAVDHSFVEKALSSIGKAARGK